METLNQHSRIITQQFKFILKSPRLLRLQSELLLGISSLAQILAGHGTPLSFCQTKNPAVWANRPPPDTIDRGK